MLLNPWLLPHHTLPVDGKSSDKEDVEHKLHTLLVINFAVTEFRDFNVTVFCGVLFLRIELVNM